MSQMYVKCVSPAAENAGDPPMYISPIQICEQRRDGHLPIQIRPDSGSPAMSEDEMQKRRLSPGLSLFLVATGPCC